MIGWLRRWTVIVAVAVLGVIGLQMVRGPGAAPAVLAALDPDPYVACPVAEAGGGFSSRVGVSSQVGGQISVIGGGTRVVEVPNDGAFFTEVGDMAELGTTPILVEALGTAAIFSRAGTVAAVSGCMPAAAGSVAVMGMSTAEGDASTLVITNPFAADAAVRLIGASEFGPDTPAGLEELTVPPATTVEIVLDQSMTGRQSLSFAVAVDSGLVVAGMKRSGPTDVATSEAVAGGTQWFFPLPDFGFDGEIHVRSLADVETAFRIDRIQPDGIVEGVMEGSLAPQTLSVVPVEEIAGPGSGIVVSTAEPVAAAIVFAVDDVRAVSPGLTGEATSWSAPVSATAGEGQTAAWILNTSGQALTATIQRPGYASIQTVRLPTGMTTGVMVTGAGGGAFEVEADGPVAVLYGVLSTNSIGVTAANPAE